jgi:transposase
MEVIMSNKTQRAKLTLNSEELKDLTLISHSRTMPKREVERAQILLHYHANLAIAEIQRKVGVARPTIYKCIDKALAMGIKVALKDLYHRPKEPEITEEAKAWVTNLACTKPKDLGFAAEVWSRQSLANYVREHAEKAGHGCLKLAAKATIQRILKDKGLQPHKIKYYLEKRDPEFEEKMKDVLMVYREVQLQNNCANHNKGSEIYTVSIDEKPGVQAIGNTAPDLPPVAHKHATIARDYEYKRLGTVSILAALDLHDGHLTARVEDRHRSAEFILLLKDLDAYYPPDSTIRIILDNHSSHTSKETMAYLATRPNRFVYVHTPKHGSWLNIIETVFGKMARSFLKHMRVSSLEDLKDRIHKGICEINASPVIHQWKKFATPNLGVM